MIEEFEIEALRYKVSVRSILRKVSREISLSNRIIFRFKMAHKIKKVREEFDANRNKNRFDLIERLDERVVVRREATHLFVRDEVLLGEKMKGKQ